MKIEKWSKSIESEISRSSSPSDGVPYHVAYMGQRITVTRRCARAMFKAGMITCAKSARDSGRIGDGGLRMDLAKQRDKMGGGLSFKVKPSGEKGLFFVECPEMDFGATSDNPAKTMMLLSTEWWECVDHGDGSFNAECAADWRVQCD